MHGFALGLGPCEVDVKERNEDEKPDRFAVQGKDRARRIAAAAAAAIAGGGGGVRVAIFTAGVFGRGKRIVDHVPVDLGPQKQKVNENEYVVVLDIFVGKFVALRTCCQPDIGERVGRVKGLHGAHALDTYHGCSCCCGLAFSLALFFLSFFLSLVRIVGVVDHPQEEGGAERSPLALTKKKKKSLKRYTSQPPKTLL